MKFITTTISPLPFYDDLRLQNHRKPFAYDQIYPLLIYKSMLLPFQAVVPKEATSISYVRLHFCKRGKSTSYIDVTKSLMENGLILKGFADFKLIKYPGTLPVIELKYEGQYYLELGLANLGPLYSEIFTVVHQVTGCILLEYSNLHSLGFKDGVVDFSDNFKFKCYLQTQLGKPEYDFEEEATERMGYTFIESQVSKKIFKFTILAPEYLCDALRVVRLCDNKRIFDNISGKKYEMTTFSMKPEWEEQGDLASVECEFETDNIIANIGGYIPDLKGGDFNNDYNSDFDVE